MGVTRARAAAAGLFISAVIASGLAGPGATGAAGSVDGASPAGFWVAGDLHVHTTYSHDAWGGPGDPDGVNQPWTLGHSVENQFLLASQRGLDFLAITDHNDVQSQSDPGWANHGVLGIPGYEKSLRGHAQMLGATQVYEGVDRDDVTSVQAVADELRDGGGVFQVNHPGDGALTLDDLDWGYGYDIVPDTVEVWNISALWQPPFPAASSIDVAIAYWDGWLDLGYRVGATGGSDNHWVSTTAVQGVGQPTTWVYVDELTVEGVLEGLRRGRTFVSHQPPTHHGPRVFLEGDSNGNGSFDALVGDEIGSDARLRVRVEGAPGSILRIFTNEGALATEVPVIGVDFAHEFDPPEDASWVRAEVVEPDAGELRRTVCDPVIGDHTTYCRDRLALLALTSALYITD